jgi:hypothetical protein
MGRNRVAGSIGTQWRQSRAGKPLLAGGNYCSLPAFARTEKLSAINSG